MANSTMTLIASQTLSTATAGFTFSSIPQTYTDLRILCTGRTDSVAVNDNLKINFNNDSTTFYSGTYFQGNASAASSGRRSNWSSFVELAVNSAASLANTFTPIELYIPNYTFAMQRPSFVFSAQENNTTTANFSLVQAEATLYRGGPAITSVTISGNGTNWVTNSSFYLYGIKNA